MNVQEAREVGTAIAQMAAGGEYEPAMRLLVPVLQEKTPFRLLDEIGAAIGNGSMDFGDAFLDLVAATHTMGGWVIIASVLCEHLNTDLESAFGRARKYAILADTWYACDSIGERLPGPALLINYDYARTLLSTWGGDPNRWVRRMVGVVVHYWAKKAQHLEERSQQAKGLLNLLSPMFSEQDMDAVKGVGWGLKTLGRFYPEITTDWLVEQAGRPYRSLMLRKAVTYLPAGHRQRVEAS
jgi:3-methyladenine DNA glycosylase AlkD